MNNRNPNDEYLQFAATSAYIRRNRRKLEIPSTDRGRWLTVGELQRQSQAIKLPFKRSRVTIAGKHDMNQHPKTLKSILKQADIEEI
jgi:hypothetical protein